jgi:hypothetical protein
MFGHDIGLHLAGAAPNCGGERIEISALPEAALISVIRNLRDRGKAPG